MYDTEIGVNLHRIVPGTGTVIVRTWSFTSRSEEFVLKSRPATADKFLRIYGTVVL